MKATSTSYFSQQQYIFPPESLYNSASVTGGKNVVCMTVFGNRNQLPYPFSKLEVIRTKGSSGKCWMFYKNSRGKFMGYLFSSGFRTVGLKSTPNIRGEFFYGK